MVIYNKMDVVNKHHQFQNQLILYIQANTMHTSM